MNSENHNSKKNSKQPPSYNWKGVMDFIREEVKSTSTDWSNEKQILIRKISDLEKEVKVLKHTNQELLNKVSMSNNLNVPSTQTTPNNYFSTGLSLNGINLNPSITLDRKLIAEKLLHKRGDSDKLIRQETDKFSHFRMKVVKSKQNSDDITKSDVLKKIYMRKTNSFGGFEKLFENKLLENNAMHNKYSTNYGSNNLNPASGLTTNKIINGGVLNYSNYTTAINQNTNNTILNTIPTPRTATNIADEISPQITRSNYGGDMNIPKKNNFTNKITEFTNVITNSMSEKEEESSNATQETIEKRPNYLNTSSSISHHNISNTNNNTVNVTSLSVETKIFNDSNEKFINDKVSKLPDTGVNRFSINNQSYHSNQIQDNSNTLRKSISSLYSSNTTRMNESTTKTSHNPICVLKSHFDAVRDVYLTPDMQTLVSIGEDMLINFWEFKNCLKYSKDSLEPYFSLRTHTTPIFNLTGPKLDLCTNDLYTTYSSGIDGVIRCNRILPVDYDRSMNTEDIYTKITLQPWRAHQDMIWHLDHHQELSLLSSVSSDGTVKIFKTHEDNVSDKFYYSNKSRSKNVVKQLTFRNHHHNLIEIPTHSAWSTKVKNHIYVSYTTPYIKLFDIETGKSITDYSYTVDKNIPFEFQQTNKLHFHDTSKLLISGHDDRQIKFFDPNQNKLVKSIIAHTDGVSALSSTGSEYEFISGSHDGSIRCWDIRIFKLLFDIPAHRKKFDEGCISIRHIKENNFIITTGADGLIKIFKFN